LEEIESFKTTRLKQVPDISDPLSYQKLKHQERFQPTLNSIELLNHKKNFQHTLDAIKTV
jgi:hypothetical protein